jgi:hypothetical protein
MQRAILTQCLAIPQSTSERDGPLGYVVSCRFKRGYKNVISKGVELNNEVSHALTFWDAKACGLAATQRVPAQPP